MKNSDKGEIFEVGDVIRINGDNSPAYLITMCMPEKNPSYYLCITTNGSTATIWKGLVRDKIGHIDLEEIFRKMEHDLLNGIGGEKRCL